MQTYELSLPNSIEDILSSSVFRIKTKQPVQKFLFSGQSQCFEPIDDIEAGEEFHAVSVHPSLAFAAVSDNESQTLSFIGNLKESFDAQFEILKSDTPKTLEHAGVTIFPTYSYLLDDTGCFKQENSLPVGSSISLHFFDPQSMIVAMDSLWSFVFLKDACLFSLENSKPEKDFEPSFLECKISHFRVLQDNDTVDNLIEQRDNLLIQTSTVSITSRFYNSSLFAITVERLRVLEKFFDRKSVSLLARQRYDNDITFNRLRGTKPVDEKTLMQTGLPYGYKIFRNDSGFGGFDGTFGIFSNDSLELIDGSNIFLAVDFLLNKDQIPERLPVSILGEENVMVKNEVSAEGATLFGELATVLVAYAQSDDTLSLEQAFIIEATDEDLFGDIDGLNIAKMLELDFTLSLSQAIYNYYTAKKYQRRIQNFFDLYPRYGTIENEVIIPNIENIRKDIPNDLIGYMLKEKPLLIPKALKKKDEVTELLIQWMKEQKLSLPEL